MTAAEKLAQAEDVADKLATENAKLQRAVQQHADEIAWLKAQPEAGAELAEAQAEIARLRAELARRPPREPPADLTPDEQLAFNLDEILSPHQTRGNPDLGARLQAEDAPIDLGPSDEPSPLDGDDEQPDPDPPPDPDTPPDPPTPDPPAPSEPAAPIVEPPTAQEFKRLLNFRWSIAEIAEKYRISPAEVERSLDPRLNDPPPIYKTVEEAIRAIYTNGKARTCANMAEVLRHVHDWDEDARTWVADQLWPLSDRTVWDDAERVSLAEACFMYDKTAVYLFATDTEVLQFDAHGDLQIVSWTEIETMMPPHIEEQRARNQENQRRADAIAIVRSKLPKVRRLKAMHERLDRVLELGVAINDQTQQGIAYIRAMTTDDPDFGECVTVSDYLVQATKKAR